MPNFTRSKEGASITLLGDLNPAIFHPLWFSSNGLISTEDAEEAELELVHTEITGLKLEWLQLQVTRDRFLARTTDASRFGPMRDLVVGTFQLLGHTPIRIAGLNYWTHLAAESEDVWHELGFHLVPRAPWLEAFADGRHSGLRKLVIETPRRDDHEGYIRISVEPSNEVRPGVFLHYNDHLAFASAPESVPAATVVQVVATQFELTVLEAKSVFDRLLRSRTGE